MALFINRYYDEIDWKFFEESMERLSYIEFANSIFYIMVNYMGLRDDAMSHVKLSKSKETETIELSITDTIEVILDDLLKGGVRGDGSSSFQMLGIMTPYLTGETDSDNGLKRKLSIIFPSVKRLDAKRFWYAKKIPLLLPVAWVHKWLNFIFYKIRHHNGTYSASEKLRAADKRITLLKKCCRWGSR